LLNQIVVEESKCREPLLNGRIRQRDSDSDVIRCCFSPSVQVPDIKGNTFKTWTQRILCLKTTEAKEISQRSGISENGILG
jgi:hypothetical protein